MHVLVDHTKDGVAHNDNFKYDQRYSTDELLQQVPTSFKQAADIENPLILRQYHTDEECKFFQMKISLLTNIVQLVIPDSEGFVEKAGLFITSEGVVLYRSGRNTFNKKQIKRVADGEYYVEISVPVGSSEQPDPRMSRTMRKRKASKKKIFSVMKLVAWTYLFNGNDAVNFEQLKDYPVVRRLTGRSNSPSNLEMVFAKPVGKTSYLTPDGAYLSKFGKQMGGSAAKDSRLQLHADDEYKSKGQFLAKKFILNNQLDNEWILYLDGYENVTTDTIAVMEHEEFGNWICKVLEKLVGREFKVLGDMKVGNKKIEFGGYYLISDYGDLFSLRAMSFLELDDRDYHQSQVMNVSDSGLKTKTSIKRHLAVLHNFVQPKTAPDQRGDHINSNPRDNRSENLRVVEGKDDVYDRKNTGKNESIVTVVKSKDPEVELKDESDKGKYVSLDTLIPHDGFFIHTKCNSILSASGQLRALQHGPDLYLKFLSCSYHILLYKAVHGKEVVLGKVINHINSNRQDNSITNLEVCTQQENTAISRGQQIRVTDGNIAKLYLSYSGPGDNLTSSKFAKAITRINGGNRESGISGERKRSVIDLSAQFSRAADTVKNGSEPLVLQNVYWDAIFYDKLWVHKLGKNRYESVTGFKAAQAELEEQNLQK